MPNLFLHGTGDCAEDPKSSFFFGLDTCGAVKLFESSKSRGSIGIGKLPLVLSDSQSTASVMVYPFHGSVSYCTVVIHFHSVI